jgi:nucleotidyltransferase substrate binding protein (TIGR01987 family)
MEGQEDIRWKQRFNSYQKALSQLTKFIEKEKLNELEEQGLIQAFEYTYELAWNVMKDYYEYQGTENIQGSRDAFRLAFQRGLIKDGDGWMKMITSRSLSSHTYNEETVEAISSDIFEKYYDLFTTFEQRAKQL